MGGAWGTGRGSRKWGWWWGQKGLGEGRNRGAWAQVLGWGEGVSGLLASRGGARGREWAQGWGEAEAPPHSVTKTNGLLMLHSKTSKQVQKYPHGAK